MADAATKDQEACWCMKLRLSRLRREEDHQTQLILAASTWWFGGLYNKEYSESKEKEDVDDHETKGGSWLHFSYESLYYQVLPSWLERTFCLLFPKFKMKVADAEPYGLIRIWIGLSFHVNAMLQVSWNSC
jgi:hypothetical protein